MNAIREMESGNERENLSLLVLESDSGPLTDKLKADEWSAVVLLQLGLWWSTWSIIEYIPRIFGYMNDGRIANSLIYSLHLVTGGLVYFIPIWSETVSGDLVKIKRFFGLVWMCCGSWGLLDSISEAFSQRFNVPILLLYIACLSVTGVLGAFHHFKHRKDYLIDRLQ